MRIRYGTISAYDPCIQYEIGDSVIVLNEGVGKIVDVQGSGLQCTYDIWCYTKYLRLSGFKGFDLRPEKSAKKGPWAYS